MYGQSEPTGGAPPARTDASPTTGDRGDVGPGGRDSGESVTPEPISHILDNLDPHTQAKCALCNAQFNGLASLEDHVNGRRHAKAMRKHFRDHGRVPVCPLAIRNDDEHGDTWTRTDAVPVPAAAVTVVSQEEEQIRTYFGSARRLHCL